MFRNHLKITLRQLARNKVFSTINILGLSLGMAVVILIAAFVQNEYNYDNWMTDSDRTYRVYRYWGPNSNTVWTPSLLANKLMTEYPETDVATGLSFSGEQLIEYAGNKMYIENTANVDSTFFEVLSVPFKYGNPETALDEPNNMVISDKLAEKIFGDMNPIGEIIRYQADEDFKVTGVLDLKDKNTHIHFDIFTRFTWYSTHWTGNNRATYAKLKPNASIPNLEEKLTADITELMRNEFMTLGYTPNEEDFADWKFQSLNDIHLDSDNFYWVGETGGSRSNVNIFMLIGLLVLSVAIINYVNLATARAGQRAKEVGVKKVTGAGRGHLTGQFITESIIQAVFSATIALLLAELLLPFFNTITNRELSILGSQPLLFVGGILLLALLTGLLAGVYPAFIMSGYRPVKALKANFMKSGDKGMFRKVLVTGQFCITIALVIVMAFIYRQVNFMMEHELGFHPDQIMTVPFNNRHNFHKLENLKTRFENIQGVKSVTTASRFPGGFMPDWGVIIEGRTDGISPNVIFADENYANTLDIEMAEGRFLSDDIAADSINNFIVNETFVRQNALDNPIGTKIKFTADTTFGQIVGVMKDFNFQGLYQNINPLVMTAGHRRWTAGFKLSTTEMSKTIAEIEKLWMEIEPEHPMRYSFLDEDFAAQYESQERFGETMLYATFLTLFIALLGLFGLTVFNVERRTREIGIRKVLGASVAGVVGLLSKDFLKLAGIAFLIALPIGYYVSSMWIQDFAYQTNLAWWVFAGAGLLIAVVGFLTVGIQSMKAALMNPINSLRSE